MPIRVYLSPLVGNGQPDNPYRAKRMDVSSCTAIIPSNPDGTPLFSWSLVISRAASWELADADATLERLFGVDLPDTIETWAEMRAYLQSKVVGDIPANRRNQLNNRLTAFGIDTSQVTLQTTWWQVLRGIIRHLNRGVDPSGDGISIA